MIHLVNGRGQLGTELRKLLPHHLEYPGDVFIYHTWNVDDKTEKTQQKEYEKFKIFVDTHTKDRVIFVSTYSSKENWYNHYKQISEAYLLSNCDNGVVVRLPTLIGKGILEKFKQNKAEPRGKMELMTISDAAFKIFDKVWYTGIVKSFRISGEIVDAKIVKEIIKSQCKEK